MPHGEMHNRQKKKNWVLFAILLGFAVLFFTITMLRVGGTH